MILAVRSDQPSFKTVHFTSGFNVVLAERTKESSSKDSRNGLGKSTLIEIIHFCLGGGTNGSGLMEGSLNGWTFTLDLILSGQEIHVSRNTQEHRKVTIRGDYHDWPLLPVQMNEGAELSVAQWNKVLGHLMFGLAVDEDQKFKPTFRSLISYFVRKGRDAYSNPFEHFRKQQTWDKQVNNAFLLGLTWEDAAERQALRERKGHLDAIRRAAKAGEIEGFLGSRGELQAERVRVYKQTESLSDQLSEFRVYPQYEEIETRASRITADIHNLNNDNITDRRLIRFYETDLDAETPPPSSGEIGDLYEEVGILLPDIVKRQIDEANEFHRQVVRNRQDFLNSEKLNIQRAIDARTESIRQLSDERAKLMGILNTHGALAEYTRLQEKLSSEVALLHQLDSRLANLKKFDEGLSELKIQHEMLLQRTLIGYEERETLWQAAIDHFNRNSQALYNVPGSLLIDVTDQGFEFDVEIKRAKSQGINSMKIFCYDLMLAQLWSGRIPSPGFLVHDSTIFDGVDERQVAIALQMAATATEESNFQYICTLNSDQVPTNDFSTDFELDPYICLRLSDAEESGGLLGIRF